MKKVMLAVLMLGVSCVAIQAQGVARDFNTFGKMYLDDQAVQNASRQAKEENEAAQQAMKANADLELLKKACPQFAQSIDEIIKLHDDMVKRCTWTNSSEELLAEHIYLGHENLINAVNKLIEQDPALGKQVEKAVRHSYWITLKKKAYTLCKIVEFAYEQHTYLKACPADEATFKAEGKEIPAKRMGRK